MKRLNRKKFFKAVMEDHYDNPILRQLREREHRCSLCGHLPTPKPKIASEQEWLCKCSCHKSDKNDIGEFSDEEISDEFNRRELHDDARLEQIWLDFRGKDCPQSLKDYLWVTLGKAL